MSPAAMPWSIIRSTHSFEFLADLIEVNTEDDVVRLPALRIQPMAASDLGRVLAEVAGAPAGAGIQEIAGPDELGLDEWGHQLAGYAGLRPRIMTAPTARPFFGAAIDERALLPAQVPAGRPRACSPG